MPVKFQREHTFACFISSSAISIRFLRNAAILFCLKLISSVKKEQRQNKQSMTEVSVMPLMFHEICCTVLVTVFDHKEVQELAFLFVARDAFINTTLTSW